MNIKKLEKIIIMINQPIIIMLFLMYGIQVSYAASVNVAWNANTESDLAGYRIYYGTSPGNYPSSQQTGKVTSYTLTNLNEGTTYYIALAAFDTSSNESQKSTETSGIARGPEQCTDGIDNDGDGFADCSDSECGNQPCNDNSLCTSGDRCLNLQCQGMPINCDDGNMCTNDSCSPASGCVHVNNTAPCDDTNVCTTSSFCSNGLCQGGSPINCNDGDGCTSDSCDPQAGCLHTAISGCGCDQDTDCTDSNLCTGIERCISGSCVAGTPLTCDDGNSCTDDSCNPLSGCAYSNNTAPCDDGLFCNGFDTCGSGSCSVHSGDPCRQLTCNEESNICEEGGIICDNADACSSYTGSWSLSIRPDAFEGNARISSKNVTHRWAPALPQSGFYDVSMWWSSLPQSCRNCSVDISCNGTPIQSLSVNQQLRGGQWNLLGTYGLEAGNTCSVMLKSEGLNIKTCADAVKLLYRGEQLPEAHIGSISPNPADVGEEVCFQGYGTSAAGRDMTGSSWISDRDGEIGISDTLCLSNLSEGTHQISYRVQDDEGAWSIPASETLYIGPVAITCNNGEPCTSSSGRWKTIQRADAYKETALLSNRTGTYTWKPYLPLAGYYEVYLWWSSLLTGCSYCPVDLTCAGVVVDTFAIDETAGGGQWNLLGIYELEQGTACALTITAEGTASTTADAVRFVLTDNLPNAHILFSH